MKIFDSIVFARVWFLIIVALLITVPTAYSIDYSSKVVYQVPRDIKPCPICNKTEYLVIEDSGKGYFYVKCNNLKHYPWYLVMASGIDPEEAVKTWNSHGENHH